MQLVEETVQDFTRLLASDAVTPGGGSTAALEAALGMGLIRKVALISMEKDDYRHRKDRMQYIAKIAEGMRLELLKRVDEDTAAYQDFIATGRMSQDTEEQKTAYRQARYDRLQTCILIPYKILDAAADGLIMAEELVQGYYIPLASDLGLAGLTLQTAARAAWLTILTNIEALIKLGFMNDPTMKTYRQDSQTLLDKAEDLAERIYAQMKGSLRRASHDSGPI
jgi:formiminotetrahydrofolate cyclodeaminase